MTRKESNENYQKGLDEINQKIYDSLTPEEKGKRDAVSKACKILEDAQVPFWLFAESKDSRGNDQYIQYNWCHKVYNEEGEVPEAGRDFIKNHFQKFFYAVDHVLSMSTMHHLRLEPTPENKIGCFGMYVNLETENQLQLCS